MINVSTKEKLNQEELNYKELNYFVLTHGTDEEWNELLKTFKFYDRIGKRAERRVCKAKKL